MRILLLSLYYPPLNSIAALRVKAFENYLTKEGHHVDVITRYYDKEQQQGQSMFIASESPKKFKVPYLKTDNVLYTNFDALNSKKKFSGKLPPLIRGLYNYLHVDIFHYGWVKYVFEAFEKEYRKNTYDYVIASYGPPIAMYIAKKIFDVYRIPYLIDFRDSFIDERDVSYQLLMKKMVQRRTLKNAAGLLFATEGMKDIFLKNADEQLRKTPSCIVQNGVDDTNDSSAHADDAATVARFEELKAGHSFLLLHTGTLYSGQNSDFFMEGVKEFNKKFNASGIVVFLGLAENRSANELDYPFVYKLPRVKHTTSMYLQKRASALLFPIWDGRYTGFSGKILEYLFSENFIITSPHPQSDLKEFLNISSNVFIPENNHSFTTILEQLVSNSLVKYPLKDRDKLYRSYWVRKLITFLTSLNRMSNANVFERTTRD